MIQRLQQLQKVLFERHRETSSSSLLTLVIPEAKFEAEGIDEQFFKKVVHARALIQRIQQNNDTIQEIKVKYEKAIKSQQQKNCSAEIDRIMTENASIHTAAKKLIESIKVEVDDCEANVQLKDEPETKMKRNLFHSVSSQLAKIIEQQRFYEQGYKNTVKNKITRQVRIIDKELTDNEVEHYVNNPEEAQQMLQKKVYGQASMVLKDTVADIQDKFKDIRKLEQSVNECLQLFKQLSAMVYAQGEIIDNIELNVNQAKDYVQKGEKQLVEAKKHHKCTKKCMCYMIIITIIVLVVLLAIIIPSVLKAVR